MIIKASKLLLITLVCCFSAAGSLAARDKLAICHVGNEVGPNGETYLDDPGCHPSEENHYFCPDAGKVDLIYVGNVRGHMPEHDPERHSFNCRSDSYAVDPTVANANVDTDGDGIDEGCEVRPLCAEGESGIFPHPTNRNQFYTCMAGTLYPSLTCPGSMLFNPDTSRCDFPHKVVSCPPMREGSYEGE